MADQGEERGPLPADTFEAIIINFFPVELLLDEKAVQGLYRELKPSGLVIFDDEEYNFKDMPSKELAIQNMLVNGFREHPLTNQIGANVTAFYYHDNSDKPPFTSVWQLLDKVNTLHSGEAREPVRHRMDIFKK